MQCSVIFFGVGMDNKSYEELSETEKKEEDRRDRILDEPDPDDFDEAKDAVDLARYGR